MIIIREDNRRMRVEWDKGDLVALFAAAKLAAQQSEIGGVQHAVEMATLAATRYLEAKHADFRAP